MVPGRHRLVCQLGKEQDQDTRIARESPLTDDSISGEDHEAWP